MQPLQYDETNNLLKSLEIEISYIEEQANGANIMSYSFRALRGEYCIYLNKQLDTRCRLVCDLREKGHIVFNHFIKTAACRRLFDDFFKKNMSLIFFRLPEEKNLTSRLGYYASYIYERFSDIAKAMEINSKLFSADWELAKNLLLPYTSKGVMRNETALSYPRSGWPLGLDWTSYMVLLCRDMKSSLDDIGSGDGKKIKTGDISRYEAEKKNEDTIKEIHQSRKTIIEKETSGFDAAIKIGRTTHLSGDAAAYSVRECSDLKGLLTILRERSLIEKRKRIKNDLMYNINRNKFLGDVLVPRIFRITDMRPAALFILLDVSGSVPVTFLQNLVKTIINSETVFNKKKSRLICWSDSLCSDKPLYDLGGITAGGSTVLAGGIEYCKKYFDDDSAFFIISDFQDDLSSWLRAARDIKQRKTAIAYSNSGRNINFAQWFSMTGSNKNYNAQQVSVKEFSSVFETVLLRQSDYTV